MADNLLEKYHGIRTIGQGLSVIGPDGKPLDLRLDLVNHSPTGFECGYAGSGPAQLAVAILAHRLKDDRRAVAIYQRFKEAVIAKLPADQNWVLSGYQIDAVVAAIHMETTKLEQAEKRKEKPKA